jgi:cyanophycinase
MTVPGHEAGFALLPDSAIDQHVIARHREKDLVGVIAAHPKLLGIGIDQETAIVVHGDDFEVIGDSKVIIHDGKKPFYFLTHGQKFNLKTRLPEP